MKTIGKQSQNQDILGSLVILAKKSYPIHHMLKSKGIIYERT